MSEESKSVAFRLSAEQFNALDRAAKRAGLSRSDYVREVLLAALDGVAEKELILRTLWALNKNIQCAAVALLCDAGKVERAEAEKWVRECMDLGMRCDAIDRPINDWRG